VAAPWLARELSPSAARRTRFFVSARLPIAFYGCEAMALVLDAIAAGDGERAAVTRAARRAPTR